MVEPVYLLGGGGLGRSAVKTNQPTNVRLADSSIIRLYGLKLNALHKNCRELTNSIRVLMLYSLEHVYCIISESSEEKHFWSTLSAPESDKSTYYPHHVLVVYGHEFCSGSFIGSKIVLTVASCFERDMKGYDIFVKFGCKNFLDEGQVIAVAEIKEHEYFQYRSELDNDIALVILQQHVQYDKTVRKILLIEPDVVLPARSIVTVTGWGAKNSVKTQEKYILRSRMILMDEASCLKAYDNVVTPSMFCAKYDKRRRLSDNGGAAVHHGVVVGISSYGASGEHKPHVALFTNVSYFYKWIKLNTERLLTKYCSIELQ